MNHIRFSSPIGEITVVGGKESIYYVNFSDRVPLSRQIGAEVSLPVLEDARRWLNIYFSGAVPDFTLPMAYEGTAFQRSVWRLLEEIPYGGSVTYGQLARRIEEQTGRRTAAQAVGQAVGHNPISLIVPCHRVLGADGALTGYGGGLDRKRWLLRLEKIDFKE